MANWRNEVIKLFENQAVTFYLVNDPDFLLNDEAILTYLVENRFQVIRFDDSISIRYLYEAQYRPLLEKSDTKLLIYSNTDGRDIFPYDFLTKSHYLYINSQQVFPKFSSTIIKQLDKEKWDLLFTLQNQYSGTSSDKDTLEFILKYVYKIIYDLVNSKVEFYQLLFTMHYEKNEFPLVIREFLISKLAAKSGLQQLPVADLVHSRHYFYEYINKEWTAFIQKLQEFEPGTVLEETELYQTHAFSDPVIRRLMDDLFIEGFLYKVKITKEFSMPEWMRFGIEQDQVKTKREGLGLIQGKITEKLETVSRYKDWLTIAELFGEYKALALKSKQAEYITEANQLSSTINKKFENWLIHHFHSLSSLPPFPKPKMVHHIAHMLAASMDREPNQKTALLIMDGMSFVQWKMIKSNLSRKGFAFEENGVFAWVPTLTSVSRQAIFSGQLPVMFANYLRTTAKEEYYWKTFWEDHGILKQYVQYQKGLGIEEYQKSKIAAFKRPNIKVYGAVVDTIDGFVHGATQGEKSIMAELEIWLESDYLTNLLQDLTEAKYTVYLTADHGNTGSIGIGRINEGVLVDQKGERVRVYTDEVIFRDSAKQIDSIPWTNVGLPEDYYVLLAKYGQAFSVKNERVVSHGGISIEEVIVPFIKVISPEKEA